MHHIGYTSRAVGYRNTADLEELCSWSAAHNRQIGVTGLLVFDGVRYIQLIEGEASTVRQLMASIARDSRHERIIYIIDGPTPECAFESWDLACIGFRNTLSSLKILTDVKAKLQNVRDIHVLSSFIGFAFLAK